MTVAITPEERKRRSDLAKRLVAEGKIGGAGRGQGRKRIPRASEIAAEKARAHAPEIVQAYIDALDPSQPAATRIKAADSWLRLEQTEADLQLREKRQLEALSTNDLIGEITERFSAIRRAGGLGLLPEGVMDIDAEDIEELDDDDEAAAEEG